MADAALEEAAALMAGFADRTGLNSERLPRRYLWTDAFAVRNWLGLAQLSGDERYTGLALRLVEQVHHTLGRHRPDSGKTGWLSGLAEDAGDLHPTLGGLRIGKPRPERGPHDPPDERLEWERDGQYFHYLTQWMHALDRVAQATQQPRYNCWARELARTACAAFTHQRSPNRPRRLYWKMSIDLTRPLVPSTGQHDPLDGYLTCLALRASARTLPGADAGPDLVEETGVFAAMLEGGDWTSADPLGIGGLLTDAGRAYALLRHWALPEPALLDSLLAAARAGLRDYADRGELRLPAAYRLAFRELGLAIGLRAAQRLEQAASSDASLGAETGAQLRALMQYTPLREDIVSFWRDPAHQDTGPWREHRDINEVMLATSLTE